MLCMYHMVQNVYIKIWLKNVHTGDVFGVILPIFITKLECCFANSFRISSDDTLLQNHIGFVVSVDDIDA